MTILPSGATQFVASHPILSGVLGAIVALWATAYLYLRVLAERMSSYRNLPGPANPSLLLGNMAEIMANPPAVYQSRWHAQYGPTIRFRTLFGGHRLLTKDVRALAFLVNNSEAIQKPPQMTRILTNLIGEGVLTVETGHRRQRRVLNPAFGLPAMRNITPVFFEHGQALIEKLHGLIEDPSRPAGPVPPLPEDNVRGARKIDVCKYLAQTNLDVIGIAGFDYEL
jgi:hypothetical protein